MTVTIKLEGGQLATLISCYTLQLLTPRRKRKTILRTSESSNQMNSMQPVSHKLFVMVDFNARVGRDYNIWNKVIGRHGVWKWNSNGTMLLDLFMKHKLTVTNTMFQQADNYKTSSMHPRSNHWNILDFVLVKQRDIRDIRLTKAILAPPPSGLTIL